MLPVNQPLGIDQCNCFAVRKASRQISRLYDSHLGPRACASRNSSRWLP